MGVKTEAVNRSKPRSSAIEMFPQYSLAGHSIGDRILMEDLQQIRPRSQSPRPPFC